MGNHLTQTELSTEKEQQEYFQYLQAAIVDQVAAQINVPASLVKRFLTTAQQDSEVEDDFQWLFTDSDDDETQSKRNVYDLKEKLASQYINLQSLSFPILLTAKNWDYEKLLQCLPCICFVECDFYAEELFHQQLNDLSFSGCRFHNNWRVSTGVIPQKADCLFSDCIFTKDVRLEDSPMDDCEVVFARCEIASITVSNVKLDVKLLADTKKLGKLLIRDSVIQKKLSLDNIKAITSVTFVSTVIKNKFAMIACEAASVRIKDTNFEGLADFYQSKFGSVKVQKSIFRDFVGFEDCEFGADSSVRSTIMLRYVTFYSFVNFRGAKFHQALDLRNTNRQQQPNFLSTEFSKNAAIKTDRETFRIIKHSFDAVGNHIEANKFYTHEMQAYRRELAQSAKSGGNRNRRERFLLAVNGIISDHGQDYLRALAWLMAAIAINAIVLANFRYQWFLLPEPFQAALWKLATWLNRFADGFLPLRSLLSDDLTPLAFWILLATVVISTLTWHVLVAMRRHGRR